MTEPIRKDADAVGGRAASQRRAKPIRIANCSGFFGDRVSAAREMVEGGPIDVLFVNAGVGGFAPLAEMTEEFWDHVHGVNLKGAVFAMQSALPHLADGGSIVITGSIGSMIAVPGNGVYAAAKAGLRAAARVIGAELLPRRIRVNMVSPGPTDTEIFKRDASDEEIAELLRRIWENRADRYSEQRQRLVMPKRKLEMSYLGG